MWPVMVSLQLGGRIMFPPLPLLPKNILKVYHVFLEPLNMLKQLML